MPSLRRRSPTGPLGVVLAGGEGRRLGGGGKAEVRLLGRPLAARAVDVLRAGGLEEVVLVAKASTALPATAPGVVTWIEPEEPHHPLTGLVHALEGARGRAVVVLACDLPLVPPALVRRVAATPARGVLATVVRGQPLCGRFEAAALRPLLLAPPGARLTEVVAGLHPVVVEPLHPDDLHNVNTPADLLTAGGLLEARARG